MPTSPGGREWGRDGDRATTPQPTLLMRAPRGLLDQPEPLLSDAAVAAHLKEIPGARHEVVEDTNHYTIVMGAGAPVVADRIRAAL